MNVLKQRFSIATLALILASFIGMGFAQGSGEESKKQARITKIKPSLLFVPHHLGDVALFHSEERGFWVVHNAQEHPIDDFLLDPQLQGISSDALDAFLCDGLISIIPHDTGEFELEACHSEAGKGPVGKIAAYLVRTVAYGCIASMATTAITTGVEATGGGPAGGAINTGGAVLLGKAEIITPDSAAVAAFIEGYGDAATAAQVTAGGIAAVGNPAVACTLVECIAIYLEFFCPV